jgi:cytochrome c-type biogenesis protein
MPSYISYITGVSFEDLQDSTDKKRIQMLTLANSLFFILGFSLVFISLGASSSVIGRLFNSYQEWIRIIGGIVIIFFGFFVAGFFQVNFLQRDKRFHLSGKPTGYLGSTFYGVKLLSMYSLGLAIPFLFASLAFNSFLSYSQKIRKYMRVIMLASGILLVAFGILLLTDKLTLLTSLFPSYTVSF